MEEHFVYFFLSCFLKLLSSRSIRPSWHKGIWFKQKCQLFSASVTFFSESLISQKKLEGIETHLLSTQIALLAFSVSPSGKHSGAWNYLTFLPGLGCNEVENGLPGASLAWLHVKSDTCLSLTSCNYFVLVAARAYWPWVPWKLTQSSSA